MPSAERISSSFKGAGIPWKGILGPCILVSVCVNILSVTMNKYQFSLIHQLTSPVIDWQGPDLYDAGAKLAMKPVAGQRRLSSGSDVCAQVVLNGNKTNCTGAGNGHECKYTAKNVTNHVVEACKKIGTSNSTAVAAGHASAGGCHASAGSSGSAGGGHHGPHPHDALLYLFNALVLGAAVMQLSAKYPILQQTIVLFVIGFICSLILKGMDMKDKIAVWGDSYEMWMSIDPHLLLFTLLPALLAGDAMTIDTSIAKRVSLQCLYLAGPGVLIGGFTTAFFLDFYIDWKSEKTWMLSLCAGSILCATDPVAVVALLKELGDSPMLTVQIQGESLLNDGTAIVLYLISYNMLSGQEYDGLDITTFLLEKALMAFALGLFIGYFFFGWIRAVSNKLEHSSGMIQITLTLCCAYWSFVFVEGILGLSGVLATVASSLVLAHHMWPYVVAEESMHHVWHTFESLGNIIVFFLAGSITGFIVVDIPPINWLHLLVIYTFLMILRGSIFFGSRPLLKYLHADRLPVTWQDATLMTWGGLRGAVGLALAIQVNNGKAPCVNAEVCKLTEPQIHKDDAERLIFFVSGVAFLTTLVNATTAPSLVGKLGITALPAARQKLLKMFHQQLVNWSSDSNNPQEVTDSLKEMLHHAAVEIEHTAVSSSGPASTRCVSAEGAPGAAEAEDKGLTLQPGETGAVIQNNKELCTKLAQLTKTYSEIPKEGLNMMGGDLPENLLGKVDDMVTLIKDDWVDVGMSKVVNQCFLTLVYNNYWKLIEEGKLRPGSAESDVLLTSVRISLSPYSADLNDFQYVHDKMIGKEDLNADEDVAEELGAMAENVPKGVSTTGCLPAFVNSTQFNITIAVTILLNSICVCIEELARNDSNKDNLFWIISDAIFTFIFVFEFVSKLLWLKCHYFKDNWNRFDFFLVFVGVVGLVASLLTRGGGAELAGQTRIMRLARVLRTMRFLRIFRLFNAKLSSDKFVSLELAKHMKKITTMTCFITAHIMAQNDLVKYFGGNGILDEADESEIARTILQSQVAVYSALIAAARTQSLIDKDILDELATLYQRKTITEGLSSFVEKAHSDGAISATEAHAILHPLNHQISSCMKDLNDRAEGVTNAPIKKSTHSSSPSHGKSGEELAPIIGLANAPEASPSQPDVPAAAPLGAPVFIPSMPQ